VSGGMRGKPYTPYSPDLGEAAAWFLFWRWHGYLRILRRGAIVSKDAELPASCHCLVHANVAQCTVLVRVHATLASGEFRSSCCLLAACAMATSGACWLSQMLSEPRKLLPALHIASIEMWCVPFFCWLVATSTCADVMNVCLSSGLSSSMARTAGLSASWRRAR
jgi:hypothetical protein